MTTTGTCSNPKCTCSPCTCADCKCGGPRLGDLERRVMDLLWQEPDAECTARAIADQLPEYAYTTIATVLDRLTNKGMARRHKEGRVVVFTTVDTRAAFTAQAMVEALEASTDPDAALAQFVQAIPPSEADVLRRALDAR